MLTAGDPSHPLWGTRLGGRLEQRDALDVMGHREGVEGTQSCPAATRQSTATRTSRASEAGSHATYPIARGPCARTAGHDIGAGAGARRVEHDDVGAAGRSARTRSPVTRPCRTSAHGQVGQVGLAHRQRPVATTRSPTTRPAATDRLAEQRREQAGAGVEVQHCLARLRAQQLEQRRPRTPRRPADATCQNPAASTSKVRPATSCRSRGGPVEHLDAVGRTPATRLAPGPGPVREHASPRRRRRRPARRPRSEPAMCAGPRRRRPRHAPSGQPPAARRRATDAGAVRPRRRRRPRTPCASASRAGRRVAPRPAPRHPGRPAGRTARAPRRPSAPAARRRTRAASRSRRIAPAPRAGRAARPGPATIRGSRRHQRRQNDPPASSVIRPGPALPAGRAGRTRRGRAGRPRLGPRSARRVRTVLPDSSRSAPSSESDTPPGLDLRRRRCGLGPVSRIRRRQRLGRAGGTPAARGRIVGCARSAARRPHAAARTRVATARSSPSPPAGTAAASSGAARTGCAAGAPTSARPRTRGRRR